MPGLSPDKHKTRLAFDFEVLAAMLPHPLVSMVAYRSLRDAEQKRPLSHEHGLLGLAEVYDFTYRFPILISEDRKVSAATARFILDVGGKYPFSVPSAQFLGPIPWIPHVFPSGVVCLGDGWRRASGRMLLAQLAVHVAYLLNFDEPDRGQDIEANNDALDYWRDELNSKPLHPGLEYPTLPLRVTHGVEEPAEPKGFRLLEEERATPRTGFRLLGDGS